MEWPQEIVQALEGEKLQLLDNSIDFGVVNRYDAHEAETQSYRLKAVTDRSEALKAFGELRGLGGNPAYFLELSNAATGEKFYHALPGRQVSHPKAIWKEALAFPDRHTRMIAWWLANAWRLDDLSRSTRDALRSWNLSTATVTSRAALELAAVVCARGERLRGAWAEGKQTDRRKVDWQFRAVVPLEDVIDESEFSTRSKSRLERGYPKETNVMTFLKRLGRQTGMGRQVDEWYEILSEGSHPAYESRRLYATDEGTVTPLIDWQAFRHHEPLTLRDKSGKRQSFRSAKAALTACTFASEAGNSALELTLQVIDDFGLTTGAAELTPWGYWRKLVRVSGSRPCSDGRGVARDHQHWWGGDVPEFAVNTSFGPT